MEKRQKADGKGQTSPDSTKIVESPPSKGDYVRCRLNFGNGPQRCGCVIRPVNGRQYVIYADVWTKVLRADAEKLRDEEPALEIQDIPLNPPSKGE